jgi:hypothetical protein
MCRNHLVLEHDTALLSASRNESFTGHTTISLLEQPISKLNSRGLSVTGKLPKTRLHEHLPQKLGFAAKSGIDGFEIPETAFRS